MAAITAGQVSISARYVMESTPKSQLMMVSRSSSAVRPGSEGVYTVQGMASRHSFAVWSRRGWTGTMRTRASASHGSQVSQGVTVGEHDHRAGLVGEVAAHAASAGRVVGLGVGGVLVVEVVGAVQGDGGQDQVAVAVAVGDVAGPGHAGVDGVLEQRGVVGVVGVGGDYRLEEVDVLGHGRSFPGGPCLAVNGRAPEGGWGFQSRASAR
ncbi:hypothetical protein [Streptomyces sp. 2-1]|uniref:hypothetical protein n=1 Tax=Streptomyces sp. 2-1 TaxID=412710 RepID=UPI003AFAB261